MIWFCGALSAVYVGLIIWGVVDLVRFQRRSRELEALYDELFEALKQEREKLADLYYWRH